MPDTLPDPHALEDILSEPTAPLVEAMRALDGDILILGAGGKMGPTLAMLARRASDQAGTPRRVLAAARFSDGALPTRLASRGIEPLPVDLLDPAQVAALPRVPNVLHLAGQKFGTTGDEARTWAINALVPGFVAEHLRGSRIVALSTGNVYPLSPIDGEGPTEQSPTGPVGEYAQSALARERILEHCSRRHGTPMAILRLNYAIEPRYGVLRDIADRVWRGEAVSLAMGKVNVIWQRDANAIALRMLHHCASPPAVLNLTGLPAVRVRTLAEWFGARWGRPPIFDGSEAATALLSDASAMVARFGPPPMTLDAMLTQVASWVERGGMSLDKPTHFEQREGRF